MNDTSKFQRQRQRVGAFFKLILVKAAQEAHKDIYAYHTHLYEFTKPDENGQLKLTDEQKQIAADWVFMNNTIVSSLAKRDIKDLFYDLK